MFFFSFFYSDINTNNNLTEDEQCNNIFTFIMYTFRTKIDSIYITFEATVKTYRKQQQPKNKKKQKTNAHIYNIGLIHVRSNPRDKINVWGETISVVHSMLFHRKNCTPCEIRYTRNNDAFIAVYERAKKVQKRVEKSWGGPI